METALSKLRLALVASTILAVPVLASAQPVSGLYIGGGGGWNHRDPSDVDLAGNAFGLAPNAPARTNAGRLKFEDGYVGVLSLGWGFGNGLRAEIEGNFRDNAIRNVTGFSLNSTSNTGRVRQYGGMANVFYDFDPGFFGFGTSYLQPYVGVGAGYVVSEYSNVGSYDPGQQLRLRINGSDGQFAYQGIAGLAFPLTWAGVPGLTFTTEYRFFGTLEPSLQGRVNSTVNGATLARGKVEPENYNHSVLVGLRYAFNQPVPAAAAAPITAPTPQIARTYLVFFDWDRADLTARAKEIIGEAAVNARRVQSTRIEVAGHADRSGTPQYNQGLSQRRADAVAAELVARGISRNEITIQAFGETRPLVATADGVREPQNRRVEIVLR
jgi:OmpA-OmpF porin, OOP family